MRKKDNLLRPIKIAHNCKTAAITSDRLLVIREDQSLWMLCPFTSEMMWKMRRYPEEELPFKKPKFRKLMDDASDVQASATTVAVIKTDGSLWAWDYRSLDPEAGFVKLAEQIQAVAVNDNVLLAVDQEKNLISWKREDGQFLQDPEPILREVWKISAGVAHYGAIKTDGSLWMWGKNDCGQLGIGNHREQEKPVKVMEGVTEVSLGARHSAAIDENGRLWTWGDNEVGQLGKRFGRSRKRPGKVMKNVRQVSLGYSHTGAVDRNGEVWMCGFNGKYGCLGNGKMRNLRHLQLIGKKGGDLIMNEDKGMVVCKNENVILSG